MVEGCPVPTSCNLCNPCNFRPSPSLIPQASGPRAVGKEKNQLTRLSSPESAVSIRFSAVSIAESAVSIREPAVSIRFPAVSIRSPLPRPVLPFAMLCADGKAICDQIQLPPKTRPPSAERLLGPPEPPGGRGGLNFGFRSSLCNSCNLFNPCNFHTKSCRPF